MLENPTTDRDTTQTRLNDCWNKIGDKNQSGKRCEKLAEMIRCRNCPVFITAGRSLLDRPLDEEYQRQLTEHYGSPIQAVKTHYRKSFVFRAGNEWLGLRPSLIHEIVNMGPIHSIPHKSSRVFRGIVNIRGRLEICVSIGGVLRIEPAHTKYGLSPERLVVVVKAGQSVVFPVSEVMGPVQYEKDDVKPLPITISGSKAAYTKGILSINGKDIGLLDDVLLFRVLTRNLE